MWALVTGATSGIGLEFARALAQRGFHLALLARTSVALRAVAEELETQHRIRTHVIVQDLAAEDAALHVAKDLHNSGIDVELLVSNAGIGTVGPVSDASILDRQPELNVNIRATVGLTQAFLPDMLERGHGSLLFVGSLAGTRPVPYMASYSASNAYVEKYGLALWAELRHTDIRVLTVAPGPVATDFATHNGVSWNPAWFATLTMSPETVVKRSLRALEKNRGYFVPDRRYRILAKVASLLPGKLLARTIEPLMRKVASKRDH
ncbi:SDR family NAD(P)-dependent oxidoreductase [Haloglycomyces albus]|uniref:SDR family NAD(P)-dependent oxidoreductase n=1 Tax=Haloglycomyces albus TaxID=526067 RepID=UPI00046CC583|nr:SDR family oxidoreductase [Haloglycomyces albus]